MDVTVDERVEKKGGKKLCLQAPKTRVDLSKGGEKSQKADWSDGNGGK